MSYWTHKQISHGTHEQISHGIVLLVRAYKVRLFVLLSRPINNVVLEDRANLNLCFLSFTIILMRQGEK